MAMSDINQSLASNDNNQMGSSRLLVLCVVLGFAAGFAFFVFGNGLGQWSGSTKIWFAAGCLLGGGAFGAVNYWLFKQLYLRHLSRLVGVIEAVGDGDLTRRCDFDSDGEVGQIAHSVNQMSASLNSTISDIAVSTDKVSNAVKKLSGITTNTHSAMQRQQSETDQAATAMNEMAASVQEVARNAESAAEAAKDADEAAKSGSNVASTAMRGIEALTGEVEKAGSVIQKLEEDSQSIGVVLEVIQGIAEQTNLLALNAAIEAARAGEQGRGFAVVADEVRTLASRTQQSTEEIKKMIEQLQSGAADAVKVMGSAKDKAEDGEQSVGKAVESLSSIGDAVGTIDEMNTQIASAAKEQSSVAEEINKNIVSINEVSEQATAGTGLTQQTEKEITDLVDELNRVVSRFKR
jgi:methyl-accepting chemotaxis protein